ncbi:MAG: cation-translocating P-type ATPase [candidate division WOR-3 bacterium]
MGRWYLKTPEEVLAELGSHPQKGLSQIEAERRQREFGPNELKERGKRSAITIFLGQFTSIMVIILLIAGVISIFLGEFLDAGAILAIVVLNAVLGFFQEFRAEKMMQTLKVLAVPKVRVRRDGSFKEISARELVPGDIVLIEAGTKIPADGRLLEAVNLRVSEAALTGESEPIDKNSAEFPMPTGDIPLADRKNMVFMGTTVVAGRGVMVVTETGMRTELGKIADMLQTVKREATPLQRRLERMARDLALAVLVIVAIVFGLGVFRGEDFRKMFLIAVSMAVAAVPEGLPAVVTVALTLGTRRMLARKALIRRLNAVETLGSVTVICSDKTGTLTQNQMTVTMLDVLGERLDLRVIPESVAPVLSPESAPDFLLLIAGGALCNDAVLEPTADSRPNRAPVSGRQLTTAKVIGDPTEGALLLVAAEFGFSVEELRRLLPRVGEVPFSSERKRMSTVHKLTGEPKGNNETQLFNTLMQIGGKDGQFLFTKGAIDVLLNITDSVLVRGKVEPLTEEWRNRITEVQNSLTAQGMRVLGVAFRQLLKGEDPNGSETLEQALCFVGMIAMIDPARPEVKEAVTICRQAGIKPVMITGDHPLTAMFVASDIGIVTSGDRDGMVTGGELERMNIEELARVVNETRVYARVAPQHKLNIVQALQNRGEVVAMTGDGVNDAPALKKADIGVAMGITGTDVAKEASDVVLLDDNFATIVAAVKEGRAIYDNIRKFIRYTFASNAGEILTMLIAPFFGMPFPLLPLQILWINLVTDGLPGIALGVEPAERDVMHRPPRRPNESIFAQGMAFSIIWSGLLLAAVSVGVGFFSWRAGNATWRTMVFTTLTMAQLCQSLALRSQRDSLFKIGLFTNPGLIGVFLLTLALQMAVIYLPFLQAVFKTVPLSVKELTLTLGFSTLVFWAVELEKLIRRRIKRLTPKKNTATL